MGTLPQNILMQKKKAKASLPKAVSGALIIKQLCASKDDNDNNTIDVKQRIKSDERILKKSRSFEIYNGIKKNKTAKPAEIKDIAGVRFIYEDPKTVENILRQLTPGSILDTELKELGIEILFDELDENLTNPSGLGFSGFLNLKVKITLEDGSHTFAEYQIIHKDMIDSYELSHLFIEEIRETIERAQCEYSPFNTFWHEEEINRIKNNALEKQRSLKESEKRKIVLLENDFGRQLKNTEEIRIDALKMANAALAVSNMLYTKQDHLMRNRPDFKLANLKEKYGNDHYLNNTVYVLHYYADSLTRNNEDSDHDLSANDKKRLLLTYIAIQIVEDYGAKFAIDAQQDYLEQSNISLSNAQRGLIGSFVDSARNLDFSKRMEFLDAHIHQNGNDAFKFYARYQNEVDAAAEKLGINPHKKAKWYALKNSMASNPDTKKKDTSKKKTTINEQKGEDAEQDHPNPQAVLG